MPGEYLDDEQVEEEEGLEAGPEADEDDSLGGLEEAPAKPDGVLGVEISIDELAARENSPWQALAKELVVIKAERAAKAESEALALKGQLVEEMGVGFDRPVDELRAELGASQAAERVQGDEAFIREYEAAWKAQGYGEETIAEKVAVARQGLVDSAWMHEGVDPLVESAAYQAHIQEQAFQARAVAFAEQRWADGRSLLDDAADAAKGVEEAFAAVALRGA